MNTIAQQPDWNTTFIYMRYKKVFKKFKFHIFDHLCYVDKDTFFKNWNAKHSDDSDASGV